LAALVRKLLDGAELTVDEGQVRGIVQTELARCGITQKFEVKVNDQPARQVEGKPHVKFARVLRLAMARRNILLVGPTGCGKTHLPDQIATALGLPFAFISCSAGMSEGQLLGRLVPTGEAGRFEYLRSEFVKCYEEGGVFLFDEIDAADANTLIIINAALANGHMAVPNRPEKPVAKKHADFVCIAAANTWGTGADRQYVGRNQLDEATLDRFRIGQIEMDYDPEIEAMLCPDNDLRNRLLAIRAKVHETRVRRLVSMRFMRDAYLMKQAGDSVEEIEEALFSGWSKDELSKIGRGGK
jgi:MoxR-like ATPase